MSYEKAMLQSTCYNNRVYTFGGYTINNGSLQYQKTCEYYDMNKKTWNSLPQLPKLTILTNMVKSEDKLYFIGGYDDI